MKTSQSRTCASLILTTAQSANAAPNTPVPRTHSTFATIALSSALQIGLYSPPAHFQHCRTTFFSAHAHLSLTDLHFFFSLFFFEHCVCHPARCLEQDAVQQQ